MLQELVLMPFWMEDFNVMFQRQKFQLNNDTKTKPYSLQKWVEKVS